jgi:hypothetical protein
MLEELMIKCAFRLLLLGGTGTLSAMQNHSLVAALAEEGIDRWEKKIIRYQNQNKLPLQQTIRHTGVNLRLCLCLQGGSRNHPQSQNHHEVKVG